MSITEIILCNGEFNPDDSNRKYLLIWRAGTRQWAKRKRRWRALGTLLFHSEGLIKLGTHKANNPPDNIGLFRQRSANHHVACACDGS